MSPSTPVLSIRPAQPTPTITATEAAAAGVDLAFARFRYSTTDSRAIAVEADAIRAAEMVVHGRLVLDDNDRWERARGRVALRAATTLREDQIAAARAAGEARCAWCTGLVLDADVEPVGGRLVHVEPCLAQLDAFIHPPSTRRSSNDPRYDVMVIFDDGERCLVGRATSLVRAREERDALERDAKAHGAPVRYEIRRVLV